jgi:shikimate dehydrogenase
MKIKKFGLLGEKLSHSFSPEIHRLIFKELGVEAQYDLIELSKDEISGIMDKIRKGEITGVNVTIPYKQEVMKYLDELSEEAESIGAVNTITMKNGKLTGFNTDYWGFRFTLEKMKLSLEEKKSVVLGGGGSARAVIKSLLDLKSSVSLVSRSPEKAEIEFSDFKGLETISYDDLKNIKGVLIVNTTPVGMYPNSEKSPVDHATVENFENSVDLIYNPEETLFLSYANNGENGLYMLVGQAVKAQEIWFDKKLKSFDSIYRDTHNLVYKKS